MLPEFHTKLIDKPGIPRTLWDGPRHLTGNETFTLQVYDRLFHLQGLESQVLPPLGRLLMGPSSIPVKEEITIPVWISPHPQFNSGAFSGKTYTIEFDVQSSFITFHGYYFAARFNMESKGIDLFLAQAEPGFLSGELENFLRIISTILLQFEGVFLFHSSAVSVGEETWVFFGPHAAGKSTIALLAPEKALVLGDDLNALVIEDQRLHVASLPFPSEVTKIRPIVLRPVTALFRLVQDTALSFEAMTTGEKAAALIGSMPVLNKLPDLFPRFKEGVDAIMGSVPTCRLHFPRTQEVYHWLNENSNSIPR